MSLMPEKTGEKMTQKPFDMSELEKEKSKFNKNKDKNNLVNYKV